MPILLDYSQVAVSNIMQSIMAPESKGKMEPELIKHMILNSIRSYLVKYGKQYGKLILCCDSKSYWRKDVFPHYKQSRKKMREESELNWDEIYALINEMKEVLRDNFPYSLVEVMGAEADDIIATLTKKFVVEKEEVLIISGDKDFQQLQRYKNVKQYAPIQKTEVKCDDPKSFLIEHIIQGDKGDGVPNFLSPDNSIVDGIRQKSVMSKKLDVWLTQTREEICDGNEELLRNWDRNKQLVDLDCIPLDVTRDILKEYKAVEKSKNTTRSVYNYMIAAKMRQLVNYLDEFTIGQDGTKAEGIGNFFD